MEMIVGCTNECEKGFSIHGCTQRQHCDTHI